MDLAFVLFLGGAVVIIWIYIWSRQQREAEHVVDVGRLMRDVPAATTDDALIIARAHGKIIYANETAQRWLKTGGGAPHLEQIAKITEPAGSFLELLAHEGQSSFKLGQRWVEASSHQLPSDGEFRMVVVMRELSSATKNPDLLDMSTAMSIINEIGDTIHADMGAEHTLQTLLAVLKQVIGFDAAEICLWNAEEKALYPRGSSGDKTYASALSASGGRYQLDEGISGWIARHREPVLLRTPEDLQMMKPKLASAPYSSYLGVPLLLGDRFLGTLEVASLQSNAYTQGDVALFQVISNPVAVAIYNAEAYEGQIRRVGDLATLQQVVTLDTENGGSDITVIYHALTRQVASLIPADVCGVLFYNSDRNGLVPELPFQGLPEALVRTIFIALPENSPQRSFWEGSPHWIANDMAEAPVVDILGLRAIVEVAGISNMAWMPLQLKNQRIGMLMVANKRDGRFDERDIQNLTLLAAQVSVVVENLRLQQREQRMDTELIGLQQITKAIGALSHEAEFYGEISERIAKLMDIAMCGILLYEPESQRLVSKLPFYGVADELVADYVIQLTPGSVMAQLWEDENYWYSNRVQSDPLVFEAGLDQLAETIGVQKTLMVVLNAGGKSLGAIQISNKNSGLDFTDSDARLLMVFATQAAAIIENARLYREARQSAEQAQGLRRVAELAGNVLTTQETFAPVLAEISSLLDSELVFVNVLDQQKGSIITYPRWVYGAELSEPLIQDIYSSGFEFSVPISHRPYLGNDVLNDKRILPGYMQVAQRLNIQNAIVVPLIFGDRTLGELGIANRFSRPYTHEDLEIVQAVAAQAAAALDRLLLYEATGQNLSRRMEELDAISRVSNELTVTLDFKQVLAVICEEAINATKANGSTAVIFVPSEYWPAPDQPQVEYRMGYGDNVLAFTDVEREAIARETDTVLITDYEFSTMTAFPPGARSALAVAILYLDQPVGILHLFHNEPNGFDDRAAAFLITLSAKASLGYGNAIRYQEQLERSERLRRRVEQVNRIFELGHMFQTSNNPTDILEAIAYSVQQSVGFDTVVMSLLDDKTDILHRVAHAGLPLEVFEQTRQYSVSREQLDELLKPDFRISESYFFPVEHRSEWESGDLQVLNPTYAGSRSIEDPAPDRWHDGDMLLVSLYGTSGEVLGFMSLDRPHDNRRPDRSVVEILEIFAHQAATMIENTRLYRSSVRSAEQEARLNEVMETISRTLDVNEIVRSVAAGTRRILPFDQITIALRDDENKAFEVLQATPAEGDSFDVAHDHRQTLAGSVLGHAIDEQTDLLYVAGNPEVAQYDDLRSHYERGERVSLVLPLITGGEILGAVHIGSTRADTARFEEQRPLLKRMAQLVAGTIQNARLFNQAVNLRVLNESVLESIQQGIVVLDRAKHIISANEFMNERFGWDSHAHGQELFAYRPQMITVFGSDLDIVLEQGIPRERINQNYKVSDSASITSNFYLYPLRYGDSVRGAVFLVEDVTERAQLEQTMEARANQLAALTEVSTHITSSLEREEVVQLALAEMGWLINYDAISLWRRTGSSMILEGAAGDTDEIPVPETPDQRERFHFPDYPLIRQVVDTQRVVTVYEHKQLSPDIPIHKNVESWMGVPLVNQGHVIGLMMLTSSESGLYESPSDQNIALAFASQVAIAEANADLFQQTFDRTNELGTLLEAAQATSLTTDLDSVFRIVVELMFNALDMDDCIITLWNEVDNHLEVQLDMNRRGESDVIAPKGARFDLDYYPAKVRALRDREVIVIDGEDPNNPYPEEVRELRENKSSARMLVPLVVRENSMGLVQLEQHTKDSPITQQKVRLARALGAQVAVAIENARLSAETTAHFEESLIINDLSRAISSTLDLDAMLEIVRAQVPNVAGASELYLALYEPETQAITFPIAVKYGRVDVIEPRTLNTDEVSFIIRHRRPLNLGADYYTPDELRASLGITNGEGDIRSYLGVPLMAGDEVYGVLAVRDTERTRAFTINEQRILTTVASQLGAAIQNARLYKRIQRAAEELNQQVAARTSELQDERDRLNTLYEITSELAQTLDEERLMPNALKMVAKSINAEDGVIMQLDPMTDQLYSGAVLSANALYASSESGDYVFHPAEQLARWLIAEDEPDLLVEDLHQVDYWDASLPGADRWRSALAVLLETNEELLGVMVLLSPKPGAFSNSHLRLTVAAANQVASSINNAQLYKLIRDQAERLGLLLRSEQEGAEKNKAILEGIADGVILANDQGRIILFNTAAERILRTSREQALSHTLSEITGLEGIADSTWAKALESQLGDIENDIAGTFLDERLQIDERTVSIHLSPVYIGERFLGTVSVFRDITREVLADRSKSEFVANVSHELRTPLTSIKGYNDLLMMGALGQFSDPQKQAFERIKDNVTRLATLVEDVLKISQIDAGSERLEIAHVDVNMVIEQVLQHLRTLPQHQSKALAVNFSPAPDLPAIQADAEKVNRVIHNLVDNAFNYTRAGGTIDITAQQENEKTLLITVKDTGVGIPQDFHEKIWQRFERHEETALTLEVAGTGLGLPVVRELVRMHNGQVWFESTLGEGTTFFVRMPIEQPQYMMGTGVTA